MKSRVCDAVGRTGRSPANSYLGREMRGRTNGVTVTDARWMSERYVTVLNNTRAHASRRRGGSSASRHDLDAHLTSQGHPPHSYIFKWAAKMCRTEKGRMLPKFSTSLCLICNPHTTSLGIVSISHQNDTGTQVFLIFASLAIQDSAGLARRWLWVGSDKFI